MSDAAVMQAGSRPVPDPTVLTTDQLRREIAGLTAVIRAERDGIDKANDVRFDAIEDRFRAIEEWRKEQKIDTKTAVDAALSAAEKAVREQTAASEKAIAKSEASTKEQATQQYATITAELSAVSNIVTDLKNRVTTMEAVKLGAVETKAIGRGDMMQMVTLVLAGIAVFGFLLTLVNP